MAEIARLLPRLPSVEKVVASPAAGPLLARYAREAVVGAVREEIEAVRERIRAGEPVGEHELSAQSLVSVAARRITVAARRRARPVVNATGVVLHTNLGRALLAPQAVAAAARAAGEPLALEYDVEAGGRRDRDRLVEEHLCSLTGAEAATVVNNNAAAVLVVLNTLADGLEVVVSRGELVEIGGSFRIPEVLRKSGAVLREVGTTNRTHVGDYADAVGARTSMLLKVHASNYRIVGFTASVDLRDLRAIGDRHEGLTVVEDLGSGALVDLRHRGVAPEPVVRDRLALGADVVTFSGDKLLGGPQCGVIVGRGDLVERIRRNPLKRALRCDKMTLAALEETLRIYRFDPAPERTLPTLWALARPIEDLTRLGAEAAALLAKKLGPDYRVTTEPTVAEAGSGSQPQVAIASVAVVVASDRVSADRIAARFRASEPPIIGRIERDRFLLDVRCIEEADSLVPREPASPDVS